MNLIHVFDKCAPLKTPLRTTCDDTPDQGNMQMMSTKPISNRAKCFSIKTVSADENVICKNPVHQSCYILIAMHAEVLFDNHHRLLKSSSLLSRSDL